MFWGVLSVCSSLKVRESGKSLLVLVKDRIDKIVSFLVVPFVFWLLNDTALHSVVSFFFFHKYIVFQFFLVVNCATLYSVQLGSLCLSHT